MRILSRSIAILSHIFPTVSRTRGIQTLRIMNQEKKKVLQVSLAAVAIGVSGYFVARAIKRSLDMAGEILASVPLTYSYGRADLPDETT